jgi:hypothetical protein
MSKKSFRKALEILSARPLTVRVAPASKQFVIDDASVPIGSAVRRRSQFVSTPMFQSH